MINEQLSENIIEPIIEEKPEYATKLEFTEPRPWQKKY